MNPLKVAIWAAAIVGLAPAFLLALQNLAANVAAARYLQKEPGVQLEDGSGASPYITVTHAYVQFGETLRLEVTTAIWPSICVVLGAAAFAVGLVFLIPRQTQEQKAGGLHDVPAYVRKVTQSRSSFIAVTITPRDDEYTGLSLVKDEDGLGLYLYDIEKDQIDTLLVFFSDRGIEADWSKVVQEGTESERRHLSFPVAGTAEEISALCTSVLTDVHGVQKNRELMFSILR